MSPGARVALVAPAGPLQKPDELQRAQDNAHALGWVPVVAEHATEKTGYLAGNDRARLKDINNAFRDPATTEDFEAVRLPIDVAEFHTYAVDWTADKVDFLVDGVLARTCSKPPAYPMQLMVGVFDFPEKSDGRDAGAVPALIVDYVREYQR